MKLKIYFTIIILFQFFSFFYWDSLRFFVLIFSFFSLWFFLERDYKSKIKILFTNVILILILIFLGFLNKIPNYQNYSSGYYIVSDTSYLNRSDNVIYSENKYILEDGDNYYKFFVNCSLLFDSCNFNKKGDKVFVKYVQSCSEIKCSNYIYEVKGGGVNLNYTFFQKKYESEKYIMNQFLIFYLLIDLFFVVFLLLKGIKNKSLS